MRGTPSLLIAGLIDTLQDEVLPRLDDAGARASAFSMLQVLEQLALSAAWDRAPLARQLAPRHDALAQLSVLATSLDVFLPAPPVLQRRLPATVPALLHAIEACDCYVSSLVAWLNDAPQQLLVAKRQKIEQWIVGYCNAAAVIELKYTTRSNLGKLTKKTK